MKFFKIFFVALILTYFLSCTFSQENIEELMQKIPYFSKANIINQNYVIERHNMFRLMSKEFKKILDKLQVNKLLFCDRLLSNLAGIKNQLEKLKNDYAGLDFTKETAHNILKKRWINRIKVINEELTEIHALLFKAKYSEILLCLILLEDRDKQLKSYLSRLNKYEITKETAIEEAVKHLKIRISKGKHLKIIGLQNFLSEHQEIEQNIKSHFYSLHEDRFKHEFLQKLKEQYSNEKIEKYYKSFRNNVNTYKNAFSFIKMDINPLSKSFLAIIKLLRLGLKNKTLDKKYLDTNVDQVLKHIKKCITEIQQVRKKKYWKLPSKNHNIWSLEIIYVPPTWGKLYEKYLKQICNLYNKKLNTKSNKSINKNNIK